MKKHVRISFIMLLTFFMFGLFGCDQSHVQPRTYTVTFDSLGVAEFGPISGLTQGDFIDLPTLEKTDHLFLGWSDGSQIHRDEYLIEGSAALIAVFEAIADVMVFEEGIEPGTDETVLKLVSYTGLATHLKLPSHYQNTLIAQIGTDAFIDTEVVHLKLPKSVIHLGSFAFRGAESLRTLTYYGPYQGLVKTTIRSEDYDALMAQEIDACADVVEDPHTGILSHGTGCPVVQTLSTTEVNIPGEGTYISYEVILDRALTAIGRFPTLPATAFNASTFSHIEILSRQTVIHPEAFVDVNHLEQITVLDGNQHYTDRDGVLFNKDLSWLYHYPQMKQGDSFVLPLETETLVFGALSGNPYLQEIVVDEEHPYYTSYHGAIYNQDFTTLYAYPAGRSLEHFTFHPELTLIETRAFAGVQDAVVLVLPEGLTSINTQAFKDSNLTAIVLPSTLSIIGPGAFVGMSDLETLTFHKTLEDPSSLTLSHAIFDGQTDITVYVPDAYVELYANMSAFLLHENIIVRPLSEHPDHD